MSQRIKQRVGNLIEEYIVEKYDLKRNKRQRVHGFYDCFDDKTIYEIKAAKSNSYRFMINVDNHYRLYAANGVYIFIVYDLEDKDHDLQIITDISIKHVRFIDSKKIDNILLNHPGEQYSRKKQKIMKRIRFNEVL